jgi:hypothetical protein
MIKLLSFVDFVYKLRVCTFTLCVHITVEQHFID